MHDTDNNQRKTRTVTRKRAVSFGARQASTGVSGTKRSRNTVSSMNLDFEHDDSRTRQKYAPSEKRFPLASVRRRIGSVIIDFLILLGIDGAVVRLTERLAEVPIDSFGELRLLLPLIAFLLLLDCSYVVFFTTFGGQTIGKMLLRIRVIRRDNVSVGFRAVAIRTAVSIVSIVPFGIGYLRVAIGNGHALHDVVANTKVIRE